MMSYCRQRIQSDGESLAFWHEEAAQWEALIREYEGQAIGPKHRMKAGAADRTSEPDCPIEF
jgi:hypothetical protein